ncbi:DNA-binding transcriptional regulator, FadR family [Chitinophaga sp. CF118]|uniref:FadR/GntR family transcriptional regulator n=1 Tax=Chitinophaga sp. CF118 TaxID=1884367 RepID=UPI0008F07576|nr:FadR/GntR family transcriptional regulator [Chitinophaga sp. CF118]SFE27198.1 DNA-binding transcriptional regulator, FadR family [Chitinophaga sp. CF118]
MMNMQSTPIKRNSLADEVAHRLQEQISRGTYKPAEKLPTEPALMQEFGVGRSTIREAVRILANGGVVRVQQGLGTFVEENPGIEEPLPQRLKRAQFADLDEVRQLLELKIAQKAAHNRSAADLEKMEHHLKRRKDAGIANLVEECIQADIDFHVSIAEASGNSILSDLYKTVASHLKKRFVELFNTTDTFKATQQLHKNLLNSIIAQDGQKAWQWAQRITQHIDEESTKK